MRERERERDHQHPPAAPAFASIRGCVPFFISACIINMLFIKPLMRRGAYIFSCNMRDASGTHIHTCQRAFTLQGEIYIHACVRERRRAPTRDKNGLVSQQSCKADGMNCKKLGQNLFNSSLPPSVDLRAWIFFAWRRFCVCDVEN